MSDTPTDPKIIDANAQILEALRQAERINPAGAQSLIAIAARAVDPQARLSPQGISRTLGLHPSVVIAITVAADAAGDTASRRDFGLALFERLQLRAHPPELTAEGQLLLAGWCLEQLTPMAEVLGDDLLQKTIELARAGAEDTTVERGQVLELQSRAEALQRTEVVGVRKGKAKERLGISDEQRFQRHAAQALRAVLQGLLEQHNVVHVSTTVAGELTRALESGVGFAAAAGFILELAQHLEQELPPEHLQRPAEN